ncbi:hypothetical protein BgiBS90_002185, partial [Biomphalaria glabrata]
SLLVYSFILGCWPPQALALTNILISGSDNTTVAVRRTETDVCLETVNIKNDNNFSVMASISNETHSQFYAVNSMQQLSLSVRDLILLN